MAGLFGEDPLVVDNANNSGMYGVGELVRDTSKNYSDKAEQSALDAATSAGEALASEQAAEVSAAAAVVSAQGAATSAGTASVDAIATEELYTLFQQNYLGGKAANPTVDNVGQPLLEGALYFNTVIDELRAYDGSDWIVTSEYGKVDTIGGSVSAAQVGLDTLYADLTPSLDVAPYDLVLYPTSNIQVFRVNGSNILSMFLQTSALLDLTFLGKGLDNKGLRVKLIAETPTTLDWTDATTTANIVNIADCPTLVNSSLLFDLVCTPLSANGNTFEYEYIELRAS